MNRYPFRYLAIPLVALTLAACGDDNSGSDTDGATSGEDSTSTSPSTMTSSGTATTTMSTTANPTDTTSSTTDPSETDPSDTIDPDSSSSSTGEPACPYTPIEGDLSFRLEEVAGGFDEPLQVVPDPIDGDVLYVVQHGGAIKRLEPGMNIAPADDWLNVSVVGGNAQDERGLFSMAFHPDYADNGLVYVAATPTGGGGDVVVIEYQSENGQVEPRTARSVIGFSQPADNHNGGQIKFGPDDMLYIGTGDGGFGGDPCNSGLSGDTLLGKILRIDPTADGSPDTTPGCSNSGGCNCGERSGFDYTIPADNPFVGDNSVRDEVYALGMRNPWRFSFDPETDTLFASDVGQLEWEEVTVVEAGTNHGWNRMEGLHCYENNSCDTNAAPGTVNGDGYTMPITEYPHTNGRCSVGGLGVYRSCEVPGFDGVYFYGDLCSSEIWGVRYENGTVEDLGVVGTTPDGIVPFGGGMTALGDVYVAAAPNPYFGGNGPGSIFRITAIAN